MEFHLYYLIYICIIIEKKLWSFYLLFHMLLSFAFLLGQLAAFRWRSKLGRPSKIPSLGEVDPTGTYCPMPDDWLNRKYGKNILIYYLDHTCLFVKAAKKEAQFYFNIFDAVYQSLLHA